MFKLFLIATLTALILYANEYKNTPIMNNLNLNKQLLIVSKSGDHQGIQRLLKKGANINATDKRGRTPLMIATYNNDFETSKILISAGADVNILDNLKNNPFLYAGAEGYINILKLTIEAGADASLLNRYGGTALIPASEHGYVEVVKLLLEKTDTDVNLINNLGWTALLEAIILNYGGVNQQETIKLLIKHGADVNINDGQGVSPLEHARQRGFREIERILIKAGGK